MYLSSSFFYVCIIFSLALIFPAAKAWEGGGWSWRFNGIIKNALSYNFDVVKDYRESKCFLDHDDDLAVLDRGLCFPTEKENTILLLGDSHAAHLWLGLEVVFKDFNIQQANMSSCKPVIGYTNNDRPYCEKFNKYIFYELIPNSKVDLVVLAANWDMNVIEGINGSLSETLSYLDNLSVNYVVLGQVIKYKRKLSQLVLEHGVMDGLDEYVGNNVSFNPIIEDALKNVVNKSNGRFVSLVNLFCSNTCAFMSNSGDLYTWDQSHLTRMGSMFVATKLKYNRLLEIAQ